MPPFGWSITRNIPLMVQGLGVATLIWRDATRTKDRVFLAIGICILISYGFYIPVILFVQTVPLVGMLMIPKNPGLCRHCHDRLSQPVPCSGASTGRNPTQELTFFSFILHKIFHRHKAGFYREKSGFLIIPFSPYLLASLRILEESQ